jgi:hypothetical protein
MKPTITLLFSILIVGIAQAGDFDNEDLDQAYAYLNQIRVRAGMTEFSQNSQLETAAFNHANYLVDNFLTGHSELEETTGFTGVFARDRAVSAGYHSLSVTENISYNKNSLDSIDDLMAAIYHRFAFLNLVQNEVGVGIAHVSEPNPHSAYVYNLGNSEYNALCEGPAFSGSGKIYYNVCEPDINIDGTKYEEVKETAQGNNPNIVLWPADGDDDVPPVFFEENPDPLPDYEVSGYPISIQFNPLTFTEDVEVTEFKLYRDQDNSEIQPTRLLTKSTDPNERFSALEYVLFPLERLDRDTAYRVEAKYTDNSETETLKWHFRTSLQTLSYIFQPCSIRILRVSCLWCYGQILRF